METLLAAGDAEASALVDSEIALLRSAFGAQADVIRRQLLNVDYRSALQGLRSLRRGGPPGPRNP